MNLFRKHNYFKHVAAGYEFLEELLNLRAIYSLYGFLVICNHVDAEALVIGQCRVVPPSVFLKDLLEVFQH